MNNGYDYGDFLAIVGIFFVMSIWGLFSKDKEARSVAIKVGLISSAVMFVLITVA